MLFRIACLVSAHTTRVLRHPFFVLFFPFGCAAFVAAGWILHQVQLYLLILTTVLSVLASWQASMVLLRQAQDAGEIGQGESEMSIVTTAIIGNFVRRNWAYFALAVLVALLFLMAYCTGGLHERSNQDQRTIKTQQRVGTANEKAATTRVDDQRTIVEQKQEISNAISNAAGSDDARRRSGCAILRQQGYDTDGIAACR